MSPLDLLVVIVIPVLFLLTIFWAAGKQARMEGFQEEEAGLLHIGMLLQTISLILAYLLSTVLITFLS